MASRDVAAQEESAIQLVELPEVWPPLDEEPGAGPEPTRPRCAQPAAADPASVLPRQFAVLLIEGLAGVRPVRQLMPWMSKRGRAHLLRLMPLFTGGHQPKVRRVLITRPAPEVIEMTMVVETGPRTRALAVRLEHAEQPSDGTRAAQWRCTDIEAA